MRSIRYLECRSALGPHAERQRTVPSVTGKVYNRSPRMKEKRAVLDGVATELRRIICNPPKPLLLQPRVGNVNHSAVKRWKALQLVVSHRIVRVLEGKEPDCFVVDDPGDSAVVFGALRTIRS